MNRRAVLDISIFVLIAGLVISVILTGLSLQRSDNHISQLQSQIISENTRLNGTHRDLITCGDIRNMDLQSTYGVTVDSYGNVNLMQSPITLPNHCINQ